MTDSYLDRFSCKSLPFPLVTSNDTRTRFAHTRPGTKPLSTVSATPTRGHVQSSIGAKTASILTYLDGLEFLTQKHGYTALQSPFMMSKDVMAQTAQLEDFE